MYDPCVNATGLARGNAMVVGLALIPGGNASDLAIRLTEAGDLGVCNTTFQDVLLNTYGARIATFNLRLDRLHVMRLPYPDIIFSIVAATTPTMVVIVFSGGVSSPPAYLGNGSNDTQIWGAGFTVSLALLLNFNQGTLSSLQWYDLTCDGCGGRSSQICIHQLGVSSCATAFTNCTCSGRPELGDTCTYSDPAFDQCSTSIYTGFSGTDVNDAAFRTGAQIKRLNSYSLVSLFYQAKDAITSKWDAIYSDISGNWAAVSNDAAAQRVEFGGSIGSTSTGAGRYSPPPSPPAPPTPPTPPSPASSTPEAPPPAPPTAV